MCIDIQLSSKWLLIDLHIITSGLLCFSQNFYYPYSYAVGTLSF